MIIEPTMSRRLTRNNLRGVWAAITTPFDDNDRLDEGVFRENIRRLHAAGVHGICIVEEQFQDLVWTA